MAYGENWLGEPPNFMVDHPFSTIIYMAILGVSPSSNCWAQIENHSSKSLGNPARSSLRRELGWASRRNGSGS